MTTKSLGGLCLIGLLLARGSTWAADPIKLQLIYPEGRVAIYKNSWEAEYFSGRGDPIDEDKDIGTVDVRTYGKWKSTESLTTPPAGSKAPAGTRLVTARIHGAESVFLEDRVNVENNSFEASMEMLNNRNFSWWIDESGKITNFMAGFREYEVRRTAAISDLHQLWMPEYRPVLPENPVNVGDTWTGETVYEIPIVELGGTGVVEVKSTYKLKKVKEKKGKTLATIAESREMRWKGWVFSKAISIVTDARGEGEGEWVLNTDDGIVVSHIVKIEFKDVDVNLAKDGQVVKGAKAKMRLKFKRELYKLK